MWPKVVWTPKFFKIFSFMLRSKENQEQIRVLSPQSSVVMLTDAGVQSHCGEMRDSCLIDQCLLTVEYMVSSVPLGFCRTTQTESKKTKTRRLIFIAFR